MNKMKLELKEKSNGEKIFTFFAPSRINLIGEHIDYVGGLVIPAAIDLGIKAYACKSNNVEIKSLNFNNEWIIDNKPFQKHIYDPENGFMNFVYGIFSEMKQYIKTGQGFKIIMNSQTPISSGLSSSASFGMLIINVITTLYKINVSDKEKAQLFQKVENNFIGVNSGIMDQFAIQFGKKDHFILLNTGNLDYKYIENKSADYKFVLFSSNKVRQLVNSKYNQRVAELKEIAKILDWPFEKLSEIKDINVLTKIKDKTLIKRMKHIITENARVAKIAHNLKFMQPNDIGQILNESHKSLANDYQVSCQELNFIQKMLSKKKNVFGSRMIGAGFGGCLLAIVQNGFNKSDIDFNQEYKSTFGINFDYFDFKISNGVTCYDDK